MKMVCWNRHTIRKMEKVELIEGLKKIGIREGMNLEVHSSLSSFGFVDGGADTVIDALMECVPENSPRTAMGMIADTFRQREGVVTGSGVIRTSGWGLHGDKAAGGGLDYVIANGGKALLLGVDIYKEMLEQNPCKLYGLE